MNIPDIARLLEVKMKQHGRIDSATHKHLVAPHEIEAIAAEVAVELSVRMERPVLTFTHNDVLNAAVAAGLKIIPVSTPEGATVATPVDSANVSIYDAIHRIMDWAYQDAMAKLPEKQMQKQLAGVKEGK